MTIRLRKPDTVVREELRSDAGSKAQAWISYRVPDVAFAQLFEKLTADVTRLERIAEESGKPEDFASYQEADTRATRRILGDRITAWGNIAAVGSDGQEEPVLFELEEGGGILATRCFDQVRPLAQEMVATISQGVRLRGTDAKN